MNTSIQKAINDQINAELYSAYLYLAMSAYFEAKNLKGFAAWMKVQSKEEVAHAMKFYEYVIERGGSVELSAIEKPPVSFDSPMAVLKETLEHEKLVTSLIHKLFELGAAEKDYAFQSFLKWYIDEQVEEEASAQDLIDRLSLAGKEGPGLYMLDKELGGRTA